MFTDQNGALNVSGWDLNHAQGHGSMLYAMAQHYLLTGDKAWLTEHLANFKAAGEWIERQRQQWTRKVGPESWSAGLVPPCEMGDYADWRSLYQTSVFFWRGLRSTAEALSEVDPGTGARVRQQAEDFRQAILRAADRSIALAPVIRVSDGTSRRYIPPQPYLRGLCEQITNPFGGAHAGSLVMDGDLGSAALGLGVLPGDDVPNYLRSTFNQYAADVDPEKGYQFREHPNRSGEGNGGDKTFEVAAFLERMRAMFVMEDDGRLWLARATPRAWLEQGRKIAVRNAPTWFGPAAYKIVSDVDNGKITATIEIPDRQAPRSVLLRFRHPKAALLKGVTANGKCWTAFNPEREAVELRGFTGKVVVTASY